MADRDAQGTTGAGRQRPDREVPPAESQREEQDRRTGTIVSIEDLVGARVLSGDGVSLGNVVDVLATPPPALEIQGLIVGHRSWLERLRVAARLRGHFPQLATVEVIDWKDVERWDGLTVSVRADASVREVDVGSGPTGRAEPGRSLERESPERTATAESGPDPAEP